MQSDLERKTLERLDMMNEEEWVSFMAYFAPKMLDEQRLLAEAICRRAEQRAEKFNEEAERKSLACRHFSADEFPALLKSCGLQLALVD